MRFSGVERNITNFNNEGRMKQRMMSSNKTKYDQEKTEDRICACIIMDRGWKVKKKIVNEERDGSKVLDKDKNR